MNFTMSQGHTRNTSHIKKLSSEPSDKGHTSPGKNIAGKEFLSKYEMPISFRACMATSQDTFFEIL